MIGNLDLNSSSLPLSGDEDWDLQHLCVTFFREAIWGACVSALSSVPRLLRMVLQSMRVGDLSGEERPQLGQILSLLLQHTPIQNQLLANAALLQEIIQQLTVDTAPA